MASPVRGHLIVHPQLRQKLPGWVPPEMPCVLPRLPATSLTAGEPALGFRALGEQAVRPLVLIAGNDGYTTAADLTDLADFLRSERYRPPYRPFYTRFALPVERVPRRLKAAAYGLLSSAPRRPASESFAFPHWPKDYAADTLMRIRELIEPSAVRRPSWPAGKSYAVVLTHDVDSRWAFEVTENVEPLLKIESSAGVRSAWYFVVNAIPKHEFLTRGLERDGHEIGFHCYNHDHRFPFLSESGMRARLDLCRPFLERFHVKGMRSANYLKSGAFMAFMGRHFEYDLSYRDTYHGAGGSHGCSTVFPFQSEGSSLLEIPTTVPEDYDLFDRGHSPEEALRIQLEAVESIKRRGGVVNIVTHTEPHISVNDKGLFLYRELVRSLASDSAAWITLPHILAAWWRSQVSHPATPL